MTAGQAVWVEGRIVVIEPPRHKRPSGRPWRRLVAAIVARDSGVCWICHLPGATSADHLVPLADGGSNDPENLAAVHIYCNSARSARRSTALRAQRRRQRRVPRIY